MKLQLLRDRIAVELIDESETVTQSGIIIPETARDKPKTGKVLGVGPGKVDESGNFVKPTVKVGDIVVFSKFAGNEIELEGVLVKLIRDEDLMGVMP